VASLSLKPRFALSLTNCLLVTLGSLIFFLLTKNPSVLLLGFNEATVPAAVEVDSVFGSSLLSLFSCLSFFVVAVVGVYLRCRVIVVFFGFRYSLESCQLHLCAVVVVFQGPVVPDGNVQE